MARHHLICLRSETRPTYTQNNPSERREVIAPGIRSQPLTHNQKTRAPTHTEILYHGTRRTIIFPKLNSRPMTLRPDYHCAGALHQEILWKTLKFFFPESPYIQYILTLVLRPIWRIVKIGLPMYVREIIRLAKNQSLHTFTNSLTFRIN